MTDEKDDRGSLWDPLGLWRTWGRPAAEAAFEHGLPSLSQAPLQLLLDAVRDRLVGRTVSMTVAARELSFVLDEVEVAPDPLLLASGQVDDVHIKASQVRWGETTLESAHAVLRNVHTRPGSRPSMVTAPVDITVQLSVSQLAELLRSSAPWLVVGKGADGELRVRLRRRPGWGWVAVTLVADSPRMLAVPTGVGRRGHRRRLPSRVPRVPIRLTMPDGTRLVGVAALDSGVELHLRVDEYRLDYREAMARLAPPSRD